MRTHLVLNKSLLIISLCCCFWCNQVSAEVLTKIEPLFLHELLKQLDMKPVLEKSDDGNQYIVFNSDGYKSAIYFFDCDQQGCASIQLFTSFAAGNINPAHLDRWNANAILAKAYLLDKKAAIEADLDFSGGINLDNFAAFLAYYTTSVTHYVEMLKETDSHNSSEKSPDNNRSVQHGSNKKPTISLAIENAFESDVGCRISFGAYNMGKVALPNLSVRFAATDVSLNQKEVVFNFGEINAESGSSKVQIIPQTNCWRVLDLTVTDISGCNGSNCMGQTMMDLGGPLPVSAHSDGIKFHGNPAESN